MKKNFCVFCLLLVGLTSSFSQQSPAPASDSKPANPTSARKPDRAAAYFHYSMAHIYEELVTVYGRSDLANKAIDEYRQAIDADPGSAYLTSGLAELYAKTGRIRDAVLEAVVQRLDLSQKQAAEAYMLAETHEPNPRSVWGYAQGLTRLSQRTPWQDGRFALDRAAGRLIATVH